MTCPTCGGLGEVEVQRARSKTRTAMVPCACRVRALMADVAELRRQVTSLTGPHTGPHTQHDTG